MNSKKFFLVRNLIIIAIIVILGIAFNIYYFISGYYKAKEEIFQEIENVKREYNIFLKQKEKYQRELKKRKAILKKLEPYVFSQEEISQIKKVLDTFDDILKTINLTNCKVTGYALNKEYVNIVRFRVFCKTKLDAKKYQILFKYFFVEKTHIFDVLAIMPLNNFVFIDFVKKAK